MEQVTVHDTPDTIAAKKMLAHIRQELSIGLGGSDKELDRFYGLNVVIGYGDRMITLHNNAAVYNALEQLLKDVIDEN